MGGRGLLVFSTANRGSRNSVADDRATVLGEHDIDAVVAAGPAVGQDRTAKAAGTAASQAGSLTGTLGRHGHADLLGAAGAGVDDAQRNLNRWRRAGGAARLGAAGIAARTAVVAETCLGGSGRVEGRHCKQPRAEEGGSKHGGEFHIVLSNRQEQSGIQTGISG